MGFIDCLGVLHRISVARNQVVSRGRAIYDLPAAGFLACYKRNYRVVRPLRHCALHVSFIGLARVDAVDPSANTARGKRQLRNLAYVVLCEASSIRPAYLRGSIRGARCENEGERHHQNCLRVHSPN